MFTKTIEEYLAAREFKHFVLKYESHTDQEISKSSLIHQENLIRTMLIKVDGTLKLAVTPRGHKVDLNKMKSSLGTNDVKPIDLSEFKQRFPEMEPGSVPPVPDLLNGIEVIAPEDTANHGNVIFRAGSNDSYVGVSIDAFEEFSSVRHVDFTVPADKLSYKAHPNHIIPKVGLNELRQRGRCILGYSMENDKFEPVRFKAIVDWISTRFEECAVFIGDSIHRNTLMINRGLDPETAVFAARQMAEEIMHREQSTFRNAAGDCRFKFMPGSTMQNTSGYREIEDYLWQLYATDENFRSSINRFASTFLSRRKQSDAKMLRLSCTYLIEELAILSIFVRQDWGVFVYPGSLDPFVEISQGFHPAAPEELKSLVNVVLGLKKRGHKVYC